MSDDRISESPTPPRCPVCATGFTTSPGTSCPACGRVFAPLPEPPHEADFRLDTERFRLDGPAWIYAGGILVIGVLFLAIAAPGVLILLGILTMPATIRLARLSRGRMADPAFSVFASFLAAIGVSILMGMAAGAAGFAVCIATEYLSSGASSMLVTVRILVGGSITAIVVFVALSVAFWPRGGSSSKVDRSED